MNDNKVRFAVRRRRMQGGYTNRPAAGGIAGARWGPWTSCVTRGSLDDAIKHAMALPFEARDQIVIFSHGKVVWTRPH